ncbi:MAG: saccharopine dehydrogenase [Deltaproteobacteria bacterium]|nr:saccharopine dehydrogenase [Deltaproteobacteria bacterium]
MSSGRVAILGLGMQGKASLYDLVTNSSVSNITVVDNQPHLDSYLEQYPQDRVSGKTIDVTDESQLLSLFAEVDLVIESLPGPMALPIGKLAARAGVHLVSSMYYTNPSESDPEKINYTREELNDVHQMAKQNGATILTEFGMDPGIDLVFGAQALQELDTVDEFYSYGAGFPDIKATDNPLKYKFTWSPIGVMRSYLRPGKIITRGEVKDIPGNRMFFEENMHNIKIDELGGILECFPNGNADYYAKLFNLKDSIKEMARYVCRWPGHCAFWSVMANCGFLNETPVSLNGNPVSPVEFVSKILESQPQFRYREHEQDIAFIRVDVRGKVKGAKKKIIYQLIDKRDLETGFTSMQRTVGFTLSLGAQLILEGKLGQTGLVSPTEVPYHLVAEGLKRHGMQIVREELPWA